MRTSASPQRSPDRRRGAGGFTLLELVVVLALLGLATALVAPQGFRMIETWRRATDVDTALGALAALGARAHDSGKALRYPAGPIAADALPGIPDGWTVVLDAPLEARANGACNATTGELRSGRYVRRFAVQSPYCRIELDPVAP
ncbi:MAG: prepilin-type N-terminal cleavage/methylation domain-containing protein [Luteimonas sp.]